MSQIVYTKKITAGLGYLRPLSEVKDNDGKVLRPEGAPVPLMRVKGLVSEGWEETSEYGNFIRFMGKFQAEVVDRDGEIKMFHSANLILPGIAQDILSAATKPVKKETNTKGRTGIYYDVGEQGELGFAFDIWLEAPPKDKPTNTGYVFSVRQFVEPGAVNPLDAIGKNAPPLLAAPVAEKVKK